MQKGLFRFVVAVLVVLASVVVVDVAVGKMMDRMLPQLSNQKSMGKTHYSLHGVNTPVVVVGSSRASHHYVARMMEDSLGMPVYNVGRDGCFFSYNCCVVNAILDRYSPQLIIWENGTEDLYEDVSDPLESLYPYYGSNKWVRQTIEEELPWREYVRLKSRLYQYNSSIHRVLMRYATRHTLTDGGRNGYEPLARKKFHSALELEAEPVSGTVLSDTKVSAFRAILARAKEKGVHIMVVHSPVYRLYKGENISDATMRRLCEEYGMRFLDNSQLPYFLEHPEFFYDATHLNDEGAKKYTEIFLEQLLGT